MTLTWNVLGVFWSVVSVAGVAETVSTFVVFPSSVTLSVPLPPAATVRLPV